MPASAATRVPVTVKVVAEVDMVAEAGVVVAGVTVEDAAGVASRVVLDRPSLLPRRPPPVTSLLRRAMPEWPDTPFPFILDRFHSGRRYLSAARFFPRPFTC